MVAKQIVSITETMEVDLTLSLRSDSCISKKAGFTSFNESPLKVMKIYFTLKPLFFCEIFKFLSCRIWACKKTA